MNAHWLAGTVDLLGYAASALVLLAFSLRSLTALRVVAIASNLTFLAYASAAHLPPVLVLHAALLPINLWRLWQCVGARAPLQRVDPVARAAAHPLRRRASYVPASNPSTRRPS